MTLFSCKSAVEAIDPGSKLNGYASNSNVFFTKWKLANYENNTQIKYDISIEFKPEVSEKGIYKLNGKSAINFYFASFKLNNPNNEITISDINVTEIAGKLDDQKFEDDYLERLSNVTKYEISNGVLTLYLPEKTKKKLIFKITQ